MMIDCFCNDELSMNIQMKTIYNNDEFTSEIMKYSSRNHVNNKNEIN